jgi:hypothetical protein
VDARQRVKLSLTNHPTGLILSARAQRQRQAPSQQRAKALNTSSKSRHDTSGTTCCNSQAWVLATWWLWRGPYHPIPSRTRP